MKQPDLGKKIAELRKLKGFTQEELVEKCNLNVRTLQRIESGEVSPRSYTMKIIFTALDYNIHEASESSYSRFSKTGSAVLKRLEQLYRYVLDLFNLKTNTMKKITILSVPVITMCAILAFSFSSSAKAQAKKVIRDKFEQASSNSKFTQLFNAGEIDSIGMLYLENACLMPDEPSSVNGRLGISDYYKQLYNQGFRFESIKTISKVYSDSIAIDRGVWSISIHSIPIASGTYLDQWHFINGKWYIENAMSKTDKTLNIEANK